MCVVLLLLFFFFPCLLTFGEILVVRHYQNHNPHQNIQDGQTDLDPTTPPWLGSALGPPPKSFVS